MEAPSAAAPRSSSSSSRGGKPQLNKSPSSLRTDAVKTHLRRRSVAIVTEMGVLNQSEAQALVGVMTVEELLQNVARLDRKRRSIAAMIKPPAKGGLLAPEADALVLALTSEEQQRTIERAGLAATDILHDEVKLRARASIALQHPKPALSIAEAVKHEPSALPKAELRARLLALEKLFSEEPEDEDAAGHIQAVWRGHHAREVLRDEMQQTASSGEGEKSATSDMTFGGVAFSPEFLDEFMLTPGEFDAVADSDAWAEQLLLMYNDDRAAHGLPPLEAEPFQEDEAEAEQPASTLDDGKPTLDTRASSGVWRLWDEDPPATNDRMVVHYDPDDHMGHTPPAQPPVPPDVQAFIEKLDDEDREHLGKLYRLGALMQHDPVQRQERYLKAVARVPGNVKVGHS